DDGPRNLQRWNERHHTTSHRDHRQHLHHRRLLCRSDARQHLILSPEPSPMPQSDYRRFYPSIEFVSLFPNSINADLLAAELKKLPLTQEILGVQASAAGAFISWGTIPTDDDFFLVDTAVQGFSLTETTSDSISLEDASTTFAFDETPVDK